MKPSPCPPPNFRTGLGLAPGFEQRSWAGRSGGVVCRRENGFSTSARASLPREQTPHQATPGPPTSPLLHPDSKTRRHTLRSTCPRLWGRGGAGPGPGGPARPPLALHPCSSTQNTNKRFPQSAQNSVKTVPHVAQARVLFFSFEIKSRLTGFHMGLHTDLL